MTQESHSHHEDDLGHTHDHHHGHGHANDQGLSGMVRYLRLAPRMWRSDVNNAVADLVAPKPDETVLDLGAGMGAGAVVVAASGAKVVAVEPTPFLRRVLKFRRLIQKNRKRITVIDAAAEQLLVPDNSIDAIWSVNTMHHWVDKRAAAVEIVRSLKPTGRLMLVDEDFSDPEHPEFERWGRRERESDDDETEDQSHHGFTMVEADEMGELFVAAGLTTVSAEKRLIDGRPSIVVRNSA